MKGEVPKNQFKRPGVVIDAEEKRVWGMVLWRDLRIGDTVSDFGVVRDIVVIEEESELSHSRRQYVFDHKTNIPLWESEVFAFVNLDA